MQIFPQHQKLFTLLALVAAATGCDTRNSSEPDDAIDAVTSSLIVNAVIYDGSGGDPQLGALRIDGDRIVALGELAPLDGEHVIDAGGLALAPGFIDTHSHHDSDMNDYRHMPGVLSQGITTIVRGLDGSDGGFDVGAGGSLAGFAATFDERPAAANVASFSPHNSIRRYVLGDDYERPASDNEVRIMQELVAADMEAGALGLATGLEYVPGIYSTTEEVIALARVAAKHGGRYSSHIRDEDDRMIEAIDELLRIGLEAELPVHVSHIKLADRDFWGTADTLLGKLSAARAEGINVTADIYPYQRWASNLAVLFPERDFHDRSVAEFTFAHTAAPEDIVFSYFGPNPEYVGLSIADVARITEQSPEDTLLELAQAADAFSQESGERGAGIIAKGMDESDVAELMLWDYTNICSDGGHGPGHPRGYGAFPRVFARFVRELGILDLSTAIHKMTALAADSAGLGKRGRLREGNFADLVLFDPETIEDKSTMLDSTALSTGISKVWVNGVLAFDDGQPTMVYPGRIVVRDEQ